MNQLTLAYVSTAYNETFNLRNSIAAAGWLGKT
jgi:hypothetical protein